MIMKGTLIRFATGIGVAASFAAIAVLPASAAVTLPRAPVVNISNPQSGDYLRRGANWISGVACDPDAPIGDSTAGIDRVQIFIGDRDTGGGTPSWRPGGVPQIGRAHV